MTEYEKLKKIIDEIDVLINNQVSWGDADFQAWRNNATRWIINKFGETSYELKNFNYIHFQTMVISRQQEISACKNGLLQAKAILKNYLDECDTKGNNNQSFNLSKIFIVHGHDGELKQEVARIIERQDIEAIILSDMANQGKTIIEKIEKYSDVGCAICLFTADDLGKEKNENELKSRARQNVVFETGYFMGKLGREHIAILADKGIEMPNDLSGVVYTDRANWQFDLCKELKAMGFNIDANKLI